MRIACCVPGCRRTRNDDHKGEWICGVHWKTIPRTTIKKPLFDAAKKYRNRFGNNHYSTYKAGSPQRLEAVALDRVWRAAWETCKSYAIERAMGLT